MAALRASTTLTAAALVLVAAAPAGTPAPGPPTRAEAWIARVVAPTVVRAQAGSGAIVTRVGTEARWNGGPVGLLVLDSRTIGERLWLRVQLPIRPNGSAGWISQDRVQLRRTLYRIEISTGRRLVRLLHRGRVIRTYRAVVGQPRWPTPRGLFAVSERVPQPDPRDFLGPWALHLTAHSNVLDDYGGGPGRVAIHGRAGESLLDPLGTARSHGCIRIDNAAVRRLARIAIPGTPVHVRS